MPMDARAILAMVAAAWAGGAAAETNATRPAWAPLLPPHHLGDLIRDGGRLLSVMRLPEQEGRETWFYFVEKDGRLLRCAERHPEGPGRPSVSERCEGAVTAAP